MRPVVLRLALLCVAPFALIALSCPPDVIEPQIDESRAIEIATRQVLFEPEATEAVMDDAAEPPVWRVTMRGRLPGQSVFAFEEAVVEIDAVSGDVLRVE